MKKLMNLLLLALLALSVSVVAAQDGDTMEGEETFVARLLLQDDISGTMTENEDGTYTLTIMVEELGDVETILPFANRLQEINLITFLNEWGATENANMATLSHEDGLIELSLSAPSYDAEANSITFTAEVLQAYDVLGDAEKAEVPAEFSNADLLHQFTSDFETALASVEENVVRFTSCEVDVPSYYSMVQIFNSMRDSGQVDPRSISWYASSVQTKEDQIRGEGCQFNDIFSGYTPF